jgi:hypothetical protein
MLDTVTDESFGTRSVPPLPQLLAGREAAPGVRARRRHARRSVRRIARSTNAWRVYEFTSGHKPDDLASQPRSSGRLDVPA